MDLKNYQEQAQNRTSVAQLEEYIGELIELFISATGIKSISYYKYDYEYNDYLYEYTLDERGQRADIEDLNIKTYDLLLKHDEIIFGKFVIYERFNSDKLIRTLFKKIKKNFYKKYEIEKEIFGSESLFNIYLIHDEILGEFAKNLKAGLKGLFNVDIIIDNSISKNMSDLNSKDLKHIIIYLVNSEEVIEHDKEIIKKLNELIIVIGPNDHKLSMLCGKLGVQSYIPINEFRAEDIKTIVLNTRQKLLNKNKFDNKVIAIGGISGGIGTTTIAMNMSDLIAKNLPDKNILYIDLSITKAISNLFMQQNPLPEKTILDLINSNESNITNNLENGLVKVKENFYAINGIQRHIDKELIEQSVFIEKLLDYIIQTSEYFNFIIIDIGVVDASNLKTTMYDLANEIWLTTEMTLPHISKLKTFYSLIKRAGLKDKLSFLVNRYDSQNAISVSDVTSILNMSSEDKIYFDFKMPNDYQTLGQCWNYCELASQTQEDSDFVKTLNEILTNKGFYLQKDAKKEKKLSSLFSFLKKKSAAAQKEDR